MIIKCPKCGSENFCIETATWVSCENCGEMINIQKVINTPTVKEIENEEYDFVKGSIPDKYLNIFEGDHISSLSLYHCRCSNCKADYYNSTDDSSCIICGECVTSESVESTFNVYKYIPAIRDLDKAIEEYKVMSHYDKNCKKPLPEFKVMYLPFCCAVTDLTVNENGKYTTGIPFDNTLSKSTLLFEYCGSLFKDFADEFDVSFDLSKLKNIDEISNEFNDVNNPVLIDKIDFSEGFIKNRAIKRSFEALKQELDRSNFGNDRVALRRNFKHNGRISKSAIVLFPFIISKDKMIIQEDVSMIDYKKEMANKPDLSRTTTVKVSDPIFYNSNGKKAKSISDNKTKRKNVREKWNGMESLADMDAKEQDDDQDEVEQNANNFAFDVSKIRLDEANIHEIKELTSDADGRYNKNLDKEEFVKVTTEEALFYSYNCYSKIARGKVKNYEGFYLEGTTIVSIVLALAVLLVIFVIPDEKFDNVLTILEIILMLFILFGFFISITKFFNQKSYVEIENKDSKLIVDSWNKEYTRN